MVDSFEPTPLIMHPRIQKKLWQEGVDLFNDEKYFESHEIWEQLWKNSREPLREIIQSFILVAAHFVQINKSNWSGAQTLGEKVLEKMTRYEFQHQIEKSRDLLGEIDLMAITHGIDYNLGILSENTNKTTFEPMEHSVREKFLFPKLLP